MEDSGIALIPDAVVVATTNPRASNSHVEPARNPLSLSFSLDVPLRIAQRNYLIKTHCDWNGRNLRARVIHTRNSYVCRSRWQWNEKRSRESWISISPRPSFELVRKGSRSRALVEGERSMRSDTSFRSTRVVALARSLANENHVDPRSSTFFFQIRQIPVCGEERKCLINIF